MRAQALAGRGLVQVIRESELTPDRLLQAVNRLLDAPAPAGQALGLDGLPAAAAGARGPPGGEARMIARVGRRPGGGRSLSRLPIGRTRSA